jgi:hypothetical protein
MNRFAALVFLFALAPGASAETTASQYSPIRTDADVVTALDISDSIMRHEAWIEFDGIARAVVAPGFVEAITRGRHGRIGFAVFTWSGGNSFETLVPWTIIDSQAAAERVARKLLRVSRPAPAGGGDHEGTSAADDHLPRPDGRTDISSAIAIGAALIASTPHRTSRRVLNIVGNGVDNVGAPPEHARDQAVLAKITINAVVLGGEPTLRSYFRHNVIGGLGCFVLEARDPASFTETMITKFLRDLISEWPSQRHRLAG